MPQLSSLDSKIAAKLSHRQIETLVSLDKVNRSIESAFAKTLRELAVIVTSESNQGRKLLEFAESMLRGIGSAKKNVNRSFGELVMSSHRSAVDVLTSSIPDSVLLFMLPVEDRFEHIETHRPGRLVMGYSGLEIVYEDAVAQPFCVPQKPLRRRELTKAEKLEVAKKILFPTPKKKEVSQIVASGMRDGTGAIISWEDRFELLSRLIIDKKLAFNEIVYGFSQGENITQLRKRLDPLVGGIRASAQRIARTEGMRIAERMQRRAWDGLGDMMTGAQIIAILDERTRPEHATRNGTIYYKNPGPGQKSMAELPDLPDEPNCRCMTSPVLEPPDELKSDPVVRKAFATTSKPGQTDPKTYDKWFAKADPGRRKMVIGVKRYNEVSKMVGKSRRPEWSDFIDEDGNLLTLYSLQNETSVERQARKQRIKDAMKLRGEALRSVSARGFESIP